MTVAHDSDWRDHAECAGLNPNMFFPEPGVSAKEALAVCAECVVRAECLDYALDNRERCGIFGGTTARERKMLSRGQVRRIRPTIHGTPSGYTWHLHHGEKPCWACVDALSRQREVEKQLREGAS